MELPPRTAAALPPGKGDGSSKIHPSRPCDAGGSHDSRNSWSVTPPRWGERGFPALMWPVAEYVGGGGSGSSPLGGSLSSSFSPCPAAVGSPVQEGPEVEGISRSRPERVDEPSGRSARGARPRRSGPSDTCGAARTTLPSAGRGAGTG